MADARDARRETEILGMIAGERTGVSYARFELPFRHLASDGFRLRTLGERLTLRRTDRGWEPGPELLDGVDLVIFPQAVAAPRMADGARVLLVEPVLRDARERGIPVMYSIDDWLPAIAPSNPDYDRIRDSLGGVSLLIDHADAFLVTTAELAERLRNLGRPVHVLPNAVDPDDWSARPRHGGTPRVGWAGSSSHVEDLRPLLSASKMLQSRVPFRLVVHGLCDLPIPDQLRQIASLRPHLGPAERATADAFEVLARDLTTLDHDHVPFTSMDRYLQVLPALDFDVATCPLLDSPFNRHKSALKYYEYAVTGSVTLASDVPPYRGEVTLLTGNDPAEWSDALEALLLDEPTRDRHLARQRAFVLEHRDIRRVRSRWQAALQEILRGGSVGRDPAEAGPPARRERTKRSDRAV